MSYDPVVAEAARAAARELMPQYRARLDVEVEAALHDGGEDRPPAQYFDPVAVGSLIVSIAALAYQVYSDRKKQGEKTTRETLTRRLRVERRRYRDLTAAEEKVIEIVSAEIIQLADDADNE